MQKNLGQGTSYYNNIPTGLSNYNKQEVLMNNETPLTKNKSKNCSDRYIPSRSNSNLQRILFQDDDDQICNDNNMDLDVNNNYINQQYQQNHLQKRKNTFKSDKQEKKSYSKMLQNKLLDDNNFNNDNSQVKKMLRFNSDKKDRQNNNLINNQLLLKNNYNNNENIVNIYEQQQYEYENRQISQKPFKILDAPNLQDDFYLNLVDWSHQDKLVIGLENQIFVWNSSSSNVNKVAQLSEENSVCSVNWSKRDSLLGYGDNTGMVKIMDMNKNKIILQYQNHESRVGSLAFNGNLIGSGSRDRSILVKDIRQQNIVSVFNSHKQEICGLKWSFDGMQLASGGNDNKLIVWSIKSQSELCQFNGHQAAVKAIAWSPHQYNLLASGGGTADRTIRFQNTNTFTQLDAIDTGSQVCNLIFSQNSHELISTHGYSLNQIILWKYPSMTKVTTLTGHSMRVLYLAISPNGQTIVTGAGDETLRFWNIFPPHKNKLQGQLFPSNMDIR